MLSLLIVKKPGYYQITHRKFVLHLVNKWRTLEQDQETLFIPNRMK